MLGHAYPTWFELGFEQNIADLLLIHNESFPFIKKVVIPFLFRSKIDCYKVSTCF